MAHLKLALGHFTQRVYKVLQWLQGFQETGHIALDTVSLQTREQMQDMGIL